LLGVVCKNAYTEDLLGFIPVVMFAIQKLDPIAIDVEKIEK
jgi:hypothetical protein